MTVETLEQEKKRHIKKYTNLELIKELIKRDGVKSRIEAECIVDECGCKYQEYSDCADCLKKHGVHVLVIK